MLPRWRARLRLQRLSMSPTVLHILTHVSLHSHRRRTGRWRGSLRSSTRRAARLDASSLARRCFEPHARSKSFKFPKFAKLVVRFTRSPRPARTLLPHSCSQIVPPSFYHFTSLTETRHLASQETPRTATCVMLDIEEKHKIRESERACIDWIFIAHETRN